MLMFTLLPPGLLLLPGRLLPTLPGRLLLLLPGRLFIVGLLVLLLPGLFTVDGLLLLLLTGLFAAGLVLLTGLVLGRLETVCFGRFVPTLAPPFMVGLVLPGRATGLAPLLGGACFMR